MVKTTVYLNESEAAGLKRLATRTGRSQAEIIREAVATAVASDGPRVLRSAGSGRSGLEPITDWKKALRESGFGSDGIRS